ncbi:unnamed protein product, partial [Discosporangium mesarthrocarpum]
YLRGTISADANLTTEIQRQTGLGWTCFRKSGMPFALKIRMLKTEALESLLYGSLTWTFDKSTSPKCAPSTTDSYSTGS